MEHMWGECLWRDRRQSSPCEGPAKFRIVYRRPVTRAISSTEEPYCFRHALEHVDRAHAAGSIAQAEMEEIDAEAALAELVRLHDGPRDEAYERDKPLAWSRARAVLAAGEALTSE